jgi:hypothetical protein
MPQCSATTTLVHGGCSSSRKNATDRQTGEQADMNRSVRLSSLMLDCKEHIKAFMGRPSTLELKLSQNITHTWRQKEKN